MTSDEAIQIGLQVSIDGIPIVGLLRASVESTNCFSADTYALTFAMSPNAAGDIAFWSSMSSACVEVTTTRSNSCDPALLIAGMIDAISVDPVRNIVGVQGRDLSSLLIDTVRQQDFVNQTASEIATTIALYHDLLPVVTPTAENVGRYYSDGYTRLSLGRFSRYQSDWDLLVQLARQCEFDMFVSGRSLYFQPAGMDSLPVPIAAGDIQAMRFERSLHIPQEISAKMQSWNSQTMAAYQNLDVLGANASSESSTPPSMPFLFSASNCTAEQVTETAARYGAELGRLRTVLHMTMPWDLSLSPRTLMLISHTNSSFDSTYRVESVERYYGTNSGSQQKLCASQI